MKHLKPIKPVKRSGSDSNLRQHIYTISELTSDIKVMLENRYPFLWISGEISNFKKAASGHAYFTLKDQKAQISAVIFRGQLSNIAFIPEDGQQVCGFGRITLYEPRGAYQIVLEYLEPRGVGALLLAYDKLKAQLRDEGLFDETHKRALPYLPGRVGIITSPTGAAVRDFLQIAQRRFQAPSVRILPVRVQGGEAVDEICRAIHSANERKDVDILVLARGGGSLEDLAAFNSEILARAIFKSEIPVVSAIGHETDYTIADFVADLRTPTPSAAAEVIFPVKSEIVSILGGLKGRLLLKIQSMIKSHRCRIDEISERLVHPQKKLETLQMRNDELTFRLKGAMDRLVARYSEKYAFGRDSLKRYRPADEVTRFKYLLEQYEINISKYISLNIEKKSKDLESLTTNLHSLSPSAVLGRGYSITRRLSDLRIVRRPSDVCEKDPVEILLAHGKLVAEVQKKKVDNIFRRKTDGEADI